MYAFINIFHYSIEIFAFIFIYFLYLSVYYLEVKLYPSGVSIGKTMNFIINLNYMHT